MALSQSLLRRATKEQLPLSVWSLRGQGVEQFGRRAMTRLADADSGDGKLTTSYLRAGLRLQGIGLRVWGLALEDAEHVLHRHDRLALDALIGA